MYTLCFSPCREEGLGEAPAGEQGAEESVQGESVRNHNADNKECMCDEGGLEERKISVGFHLTGKKEVYQGKHPVFRQEENVMEKEKQALAMTEDSWKH